MTNEQLAALAQDPDHAELVPVLWEKVKNLLYQKAGTVYSARKSQFQQCGVELWDIRQGCYMAFLEALKGFHPGAGNQFTSYLNYPFRNVVAELTRSSRSAIINAKLLLGLWFGSPVPWSVLRESFSFYGLRSD